MGVAEETRVDMRKMGKEAQWMFVQANKDKLSKSISMSDSATTETEGSEKDAEPVDEKWTLDRMLSALATPKELTVEQLKAIRIELSLQTNEALDTFREKQGIKLLADALETLENSKHKSSSTGEVQYEILRIVKQLMNNRGSLELLLTHQDLLNAMALTAQSHYAVVKKILYELLAAIVLLRPEEGHPVVVSAFDYFQYKTKEKARFYSVVRTLKHESDAPIQTTVLTLINCLVNTPEELYDRMELRNDFVNLGVDEVFTKLKENEATNSEVVAQIANFEQDAQQDEEELADELKQHAARTATLDQSNPELVFKGVLENVNKHKYLRRPFLDIVRRMLLLPTDPNSGHKQWIILQRIVQQLVAKKDEIKYDSQAKLDMDQLMVATEDQHQLEVKNEEYFEKQTALQHEISGLSDKVENLKKELAAADDKVKNADKRVKEQLRETVDQQVAEAMKVKQKELDETQQRLQAREWEVKQQVLDISTQLQYDTHQLL